MTYEIYDITVANETETVYGWVTAKVIAINVSYHNDVVVNVLNHETGEVVAIYRGGVRQ